MTPMPDRLAGRSGVSADRSAPDRRLFIHVGFPKTATTTLQNHLFARHSQVNYLGKPFSETLAQVERQILTLDSVLFEGRVEALQKAFLQEVGSLAGGDLVISHEGFLRNTRYDGHDLGRTASRLRRVFGGALGPAYRLEILVCLRSQVDLILSHYVQFVAGSQKDFDLHLKAALEEPTGGFPGSLFYDELLSFYAAEFGRQNLHVLLFEDLIREKARFIEELSEVLCIDPAESLALLDGKHEKQKRKRGAAYLARGGKSWPKRLSQALRSSVSVRPWQRAALEELYGAGNARLQDSFGLPLSERGYPVLERGPARSFDRAGAGSSETAPAREKDVLFRWFSQAAPSSRSGSASLP